MRNYLAEILGSFFLMLAIGICVSSVELESVAPFAIGLMLTILVYAGGPISGAHYNPMVTLSLAVRGVLPWSQVFPYMAAQIFGVSLSLLPISYFIDHESQSAVDFQIDQVFAAECLFSFLLALVIHFVAANVLAKGNSYFGFAIGMTVTVAAVLIGGISGAAINPAVTLGLLTMRKIPLDLLWVYLVAQCLGGIISGYLACYMLPEEDK